MSALKTQLVEEMKQAMKAHDAQKLGVIRYILSEIKNVEIDHGEQDDAGVQQIIARELKKMKDAVEEFRQGGRQDLVSEEEAKMALMAVYLPQQLSDEALKQIVLDVAADTTPANFGLVMKAVMAKVNGQADGTRVAAMVKSVMA